MKCRQCGANVNHCRCPVDYATLAGPRSEPKQEAKESSYAETFDHLPTEPNSSKNSNGSPPPFRTGDRVRHPSRPEPFEINLCEHRTDFARVRWVVVDYDGRGYFAEDCIRYDEFDAVVESTLNNLSPPSLVNKIGQNAAQNAIAMLEAFLAELRRQSLEAWMRGDIRTADRIADLIGDPRPSEHELADLRPAEKG